MQKEIAGFTFTENGALTLKSTGSDCLDLFATIGALRMASDEEIESRFMRAYAENPDIAMKILFYARDIRGGLGERRAPRTGFKWLARNKKTSILKNLELIPEMGRWDDILVLMDTPCQKEAVALIKKQLRWDMSEALKKGGNISLLAKWLPSVNTSCRETVRLGKCIARSMGMGEREYRKTLALLRGKIRIIENNLRERDYTFDYEEQPSKAMYKYRKAFLRNDHERYTGYLSRVKSGEAKMHTETLTPYDIIAPIVNRRRMLLYQSSDMFPPEERNAMNVAWNALENFATDENAVVVADGSGSMYNSFRGAPLPAAVAQSLAIYFAERNRGKLAGSFITFSQNPKMVAVTGKDIVDKVQYCMSFNEAANTNIQKVFELLLETAMRWHVPTYEMPGKIIIISDMEFDMCTSNANMTNFEYAKKLYELKGYRLPQVVFWNVDSRRNQQPVRKNEQGVILISGFTPRTFEMIRSGQLDPYTFMMETLGAERYKDIVA